jgi:hypothetical protein
VREPHELTSFVVALGWRVSVVRLRRKELIDIGANFSVGTNQRDDLERIATSRLTPAIHSTISGLLRLQLTLVLIIHAATSPRSANASSN